MDKAAATEVEDSCSILGYQSVSQASYFFTKIGNIGNSLNTIYDQLCQQRLIPILNYTDSLN